MKLQEIDRLIAEKIMGWRSYDYAQGPENELPRIEWSDQRDLWLLWREKDQDALHWRPSTDIASAWEVIEKIANEGPYKIEVHRYKGDSFWTIKAYHPEGYSKSCTTSSKQMPLAISLAALKSVGIKTDIPS